jgi:hypothetical protein
MTEIEWAEMEEDPQAVRHVILQALSRTSISGLVMVFMGSLCHLQAAGKDGKTNDKGKGEMKAVTCRYVLFSSYSN